MAKLVYSSGPDGTSGGRRDAGSAATVRRDVAAHDLRVRRDRSGRKGKTVTVAGPFYRPKDEVTKLAKELKKRCGSGGAAKPAEDRNGQACFDIEVQGDHVDAVMELLSKAGYTSKRSGG